VPEGTASSTRSWCRAREWSYGPHSGVAGGIIKPKTVDKAMIAADPAAALVGYLSTILATFGLFEKMGLSADQVAILGGAVLGLLATVRVFYEKGRRLAEKELQGAHEKLRGDHEELVRKTSAAGMRKEDFIDEEEDVDPAADSDSRPTA
jgi:hypothetical protein